MPPPNARPFYRSPPLGPPKGSARQRILAQWRGVDVTPLQTAQTNSARPVGKLLSLVLGKVGLDRKRAERPWAVGRLELARRYPAQRRSRTIDAAFRYCPARLPLPICPSIDR